MICPNCGSENVNVQVFQNNTGSVTRTVTKGVYNDKFKKNKVKGKSNIESIAFTNNIFGIQKVCVCQNCGNVWNGTTKELSPSSVMLYMVTVAIGCCALIIAYFIMLFSGIMNAGISIMLIIGISIFGIISVKSNLGVLYMIKHKPDIEIETSLMNEAKDIVSYCGHRKKLLEHLTIMAKNEFFVRGKNQFPEKPSVMLRRLQASDESDVKSAIENTYENYKDLSIKNKLSYAKKFEEDIEKCVESLSSSNITYASKCVGLLEQLYKEILLKEDEAEENQRRIALSGLSSAEYEIHRVDGMEGHEFERWCAELLKRNGFSDVEVTPGSNDQGVDIIAVKDQIRYAIQCKCYSSDLGNTPVQEVNTGKAIYKCQVGAVMTNSHFTAGAKQAAEATGTLLWDRDKLIEMLNG